MSWHDLFHRSLVKIASLEAKVNMSRHSVSFYLLCLDWASLVG